MLTKTNSYFFEIDPSFSKEQKKKWLITYFKIMIIFLITIPFWVYPLIFAVIIRIVESEQAGGINIATFITLLPCLFAYVSLLKDIISLQKQKVRGKLTIPSWWNFIKKDSSDFFKLILGQIITIVISNFSAYIFLEAISLQIFYFFAHIFIYFYARILKDMPVNQRMKFLWRKNNFV